MPKGKSGQISNIFQAQGFDPRAVQLGVSGYIFYAVSTIIYILPLCTTTNKTNNAI